jgi:hypothetical protein
MKPRAVETGLSAFTLAMLVIYVPVETWASLPRGLLDPFYLVDLIAMVLLLAGAIISLRARPKRSPFLLCAAYAWTAANAWRAIFGRIAEVETGGELDHGIAELWAVGIGAAIALACFVISLFLIMKASGSQLSREANKPMQPTCEDARG